MKEDERSSSSLFVTLTYNTDEVPITDYGYMSLSKRDLQLFFKKLRKLYPPKTIKYYACGEYGGKTYRPHYHVLFFNANIRDIELLWRHGQIHCGNVSEASVGYTLKYMMKPGKIPLHQNDDRVPEFQLCSKRLGDNYLTDQMRDWHEADILNRYYIPMKGGSKIALPRYYKDKIYSQSDRQVIGDHIRKNYTEDLEPWQEIRNVEYSIEKQKRSRVQEKL